MEMSLAQIKVNLLMFKVLRVRTTERITRHSLIVSLDFFITTRKEMEANIEEKEILAWL